MPHRLSRLKFGAGAVLISGLLLLAMTGWLNHSTAQPGSSRVNFAVTSLFDPEAVCTVDHTPTTTTSFVVLLSAGLLTGLSHCVGMCGPLVGAFAARRRAQRQEVSTPLVLFQTGRLTTYLSLGAGLGGSGYVLVALIRDWQGVAAIALGGLLALMGLSLLGLLPLQRGLAALASLGLAHWVGGWLRRLLASNHPAAPFGLGLANGLLPCGAVYAMAMLAAASGSPVKGAGIMLIFGLGTLPAMLGFGFSASLLSVPLRTQLYRLAAILMVAVGVQVMMRGLALNGQIGHVTLGSMMIW